MLTWVFLAGALICLAYFIIIIIYSGIGTTSVIMWLLFAALFGIAAFLGFYCQKYPDRIPLRIPVSLATLCGAGVVIMLILQILIYYHIPAQAEPDLDYLIVLGGKVTEDGPDRVLIRRLDKALEYAGQNPDTMLVLSGGQGKREPSSEASVMRDYLVTHGVPQERMILEDQSKNTMDNITMSGRLIAEAEFLKNSEAGVYNIQRQPRIGIVTSNFHLFRAQMIAKKQGMEPVYGIAASCDPVLLGHLSVRDALAILKDRLAGHL